MTTVRFTVEVRSATHSAESLMDAVAVALEQGGYRTTTKGATLHAEPWRPTLLPD